MDPRPGRPVKSINVSVPFELWSDRLLLIEGDFDFGFLRALLDRHERRGVQIDVLGGIGSYAAQVYSRATTPGFARLSWLGLARDADSDPRAAFDSLRGALRGIAPICPIAMPPAPWLPPQPSDTGASVTLFVFPDGHNPGDFERFVWQALAAEPEADCIDAFLACLRSAAVGRDLPREWKTRVYAYLACLARPDMPLSAAARAAELPLASPHFQRLLDLIPPDPAAVPPAP